jgi:acetylglutamate kinase
MVEVREAAEILNQALPYIQRFQGHTFVVKFGGSAMANADNVRGVIRNVLLLQLVGIRPILVHGGGKEIDALLSRLGIESETLDGLRVTSDEAMEAVEMALAGKANKALVGEVHACGGRAVGLSGRDARLLMADRISQQHGRVGEVTEVDPSILDLLCHNDYIPIVCSVAESSDGGAINVNADSAAASNAVAVSAQKLIILSDVDGVMADKDDVSTLISRLTSTQAEMMIESKKADKGMIPKLRAAFYALQFGVEGVHFINGSTPNAVLIETFTDQGIGTMVVKD